MKNFLDLQAYQDWISSNKEELLAPGLNLTNDQSFFLAYAQTQCFVRRDFYAISRAERHILPENAK